VAARDEKATAPGFPGGLNKAQICLIPPRIKPKQDKVSRFSMSQKQGHWGTSARFFCALLETTPAVPESYANPASGGIVSAANHTHLLVTRMAHDVFISYSAKNKTTGDAVCAMLESQGIRCWIAPRDVTPGMEWGECIIDAIEQARIMVLVFSSDANTSPQIHREVERAVNHGVAMLPLRIEDVQPGKALEYFIGNVHWLDALTTPLEAHLRQLAGTIQMLLSRMPRREMPAEPPLEPLSQDAMWEEPPVREPVPPASQPVPLAPPAPKPVRPAPQPVPPGPKPVRPRPEPVPPASEPAPPAPEPAPPPSTPLFEAAQSVIEPEPAELPPLFSSIGVDADSEPMESSVTRKLGEWFSQSGIVARLRASGVPVWAWVGASALVLVLVAVFAIQSGTSSSTGSAPSAAAPATPAAAPEASSASAPEQESNGAAPTNATPENASVSLPTGSAPRAAAPARGKGGSAAANPSPEESNSSPPAAGTPPAAAPPAPANVPPKSPQELANEASALISQGRYAEAKPLDEQACGAGIPLGCNDLGVLYYGGHGVAQDYAQAAALYKKACDGGETVSCSNLGAVYYVGGHGVAQDYAQAAAPYKKACDGGVMEGCNALGNIYDLGGHGVAQDYAQASVLYQKACDGGVMVSCDTLGDLYKDGHGVKKDKKQARALYQKACDGGNLVACNDLGNLYYSGLDSDSSAEALTYYQKACDGGNMGGCGNLGTLYKEGHWGVKKDKVQAAALFKKACDGGVQWACDDLKKLQK
jgi:TPR repeat protein